ncbi:MAG: MFS transporter [Thermodesulfobacteriota bacterium]
MSEDNSDRISGGKILALLAMCLTMLLIANDISAMNVALPSIERDFHSDISTMQWVINAYALFTAMTIVAGGALADMYGRRRIFFIGAVIFAVMSFVGGIATSDYMLIGARALMGIGGALLWPSVLGITFDLLPRNKAALAGGLIIGAAGLGQAIGPVVGGTLTQYLSWRWIQYINIPIAVSAMGIAWWQVKESHISSIRKRIDIPGIIALSLGLVLLLFALDQANSWGWTDWRILLSFAISALSIILFVFIERAAGDNALIPSEIIQNRKFISSCVAVSLIMPTFFVSLLYLPQLMQKLLNFSVMSAGLGLLPMMIFYASFSFLQGRLNEKLGAKVIISLGALCVMVGAFLLSRVTSGFTYQSLIPGMVVIGLGMGLFLSSNVTAGVSSLDPSRASLAGGLLFMFQIAGGALGLGLTTTLFVSSSRSVLESDLADAGLHLSGEELGMAEGLLSGTESSATLLNQIGYENADKITSIVSDAFLSGIKSGFLLDSLLAIAGFVIVVMYVGSKLKSKN